MTDLRPMAMGEMIDRSASFWRANLKTTFKLYLAFQLAQFVILKGYELARLKWFPLAAGGARATEALQSNPDEVTRQLLLGFVSLFGTMPFYMLIAWFSGVAVTRFAGPQILGGVGSIADAVAHTRRRAGTIVGAFCLSLLWLLGVTVLLLLPGLLISIGGAFNVDAGPLAVAAILGGAGLMGLGMIVAMLWYLLRFFLTSQVIAMEDGGAVASVRRSGELVSGRIAPGFSNLVKVRATLLITVVALILFAVSVISGLPALIIQFVYANPLDPKNADLAAIPQALMIPAQLIQVFAQAVFGPLFVVFGVLFYVDMRVRREGLDLELKLGAR